MAFFSFPLYQVARLFHFVYSLDLREGQVTPLRGVTNSRLIQWGREASNPHNPPAHGLDQSQVPPADTCVCACALIPGPVPLLRPSGASHSINWAAPDLPVFLFLLSDAWDVNSV